MLALDIGSTSFKAQLQHSCDGRTFTSQFTADAAGCWREGGKIDGTASVRLLDGLLDQAAQHAQRAGITIHSVAIASLAMTWIPLGADSEPLALGATVRGRRARPSRLARQHRLIPTDAVRIYGQGEP